jgi:hypothetical protein
MVRVVGGSFLGITSVLGNFFPFSSSSFFHFSYQVRDLSHYQLKCIFL